MRGDPSGGTTFLNLGATVSGDPRPFQVIFLLFLFMNHKTKSPEDPGPFQVICFLFLFTNHKKKGLGGSGAGSVMCQEGSNKKRRMKFIGVELRMTKKTIQTYAFQWFGRFPDPGGLRALA